MRSACFSRKKGGFYMAKIDSAYDYYVSTYANREVSRYDSHKKSDLRKVYNKIVKTNKESPLYKISNLDSAKKYAIDIKENSNAIQNVVASLSDSYGGFADSFQKKVARSSDEETIGVKYIGDGNEDNSTEQFEIHINNIATPQVNVGNYLTADDLSFHPGTYSFDLNTNSSAYEFQFNVNSGETNADIINKLSNLMNNSKLGIDAEVLTNENGDKALKLSSVQTGLSENEEYLFSITPSANKDSMYAMGLLGINNVESEAKNSDFTLNGTPHSSLSNTFTINNAFELTLKKPNEENNSTNISFKTNADSVADNIQTLVDAFNSIISTAQSYNDVAANGSNKLLTDMASITKSRQASLDYIGLMVDDDGKITIDRDILSNAVEPDRAEATFDLLTQLKDSIGEKAGNAAVNPMNYVNKVVVAYKNPGHNFNTPYISSIYSGMMLDSFV